MEAYKKIYNRPLIKFRSNKAICICNECGKEIEKATYNLSRGEFVGIFGKSLPLICEECKLNKNLFRYST